MQRDFSKRAILIWLTVVSFFFYEFFLRGFVGTLSEQIILSLQLSAKEFAFIGAVYYAVYGLMQVPIGIFVDKFGVKRNLVFAIFVCAMSTFFLSQSTDFYSALSSRALMGFGSSFAFVCLLSVIHTWFPLRYLGSLVGMSQFLGTLGPMLAGGPLVALLEKMHGNWRYVLNEIAVFGIFLMLLSIIVVKNKPRNKGNQSVLYLSKTEQLGVQAKRLFTNKKIWIIAVYSGAVYVSIALMAAVWGTHYLHLRGLSQASAAYIMSAMWIGYALGCPLLGLLSDLTKRRKPYVLFSAVLGLFSTTEIIYTAYCPFWLLVVLFSALGLSAAGQNLGFAIMSEYAEGELKASALSVNSGMVMLFGTFVPIVVGFVIDNVAQGRDANHLFIHDFTVALSIMPLLYLVAFGLVLFGIRETYCKPQNRMIFLDPVKAGEPVRVT